MSLKNSVSEELERSPVAAVSGAIGVVIAALSLLLAWLQYRITAAAPTPQTSGGTQQASDLILGNILLNIAYFLAVTLAAALLLRMVARKHDIASFFVSIPLVALTNFSAILVVYLAPPRPLSAQLFSAAHDLVFYASAAIVIAFCGRAVLFDLATNVGKSRAESEDKPASSGPDGLGILFIALLLLALWSWLVFAGQIRLTRTLLPEVTHPIEVKPVKSGA